MERAVETGCERARAAARALFDAERTLRQHPHQTELCRAALRRCRQAVTAATGDAPLRLRLGCGEATVDGEVVFAFALHEAPFGALRTAGIGEVVLPCGIGADAVEQLAQALAAVVWSDEPSHDPAALLCTRAPDVHLRAATAAEATDSGGSTRADWWLLPPALPPSARLQATVERALHDNLAARCARQLFADLDEFGAAPVEALEPLFATLLQRGDLASAAWVLEQAQHHELVPAEGTAALLALARAHCDDRRLRDLLAHAGRERLLDLLALVIQLGDDATARLGRLARALQHPLAAWIDDLVGPR